MRVHELNDEVNLHFKLEQLSDKFPPNTSFRLQKLRLKNMLVESNVAEILVTLHSTPLASSRANGGAFIKTEAGKHLPSSHVGDMDLGDHLFGSASSHELCERIKMQVSRELSDDDELDMERDMLRRDRSGCSPSDLDRLRRERNRMHAKKTRLRKKKMLSELEQLVDYLSGEVSQLHQQVLAQRKLEGLPTIDLSILESGSWSGAEGADDDKHGDDEHDDDDDEEDGEDHRHERGAPKERPRRAQSSSSDECDGGGRSTISDDAVSSNSEERGTTTTAETSSSSSFCSSSSMGSNRYIPTPAYIHDGIQSKASQEADVQARVSSSSSGSDEGDDVSGADASSMGSNISMVATEGSRRGNKVPVKRETSRRKRKGSLKQDMWYGESRP